MLSGSIRVLNFDESVPSQKNLIQQYQPEINDFREIGGTCRLWADKSTALKIKGRLDPGSKNAITFFGSGDYHHISSLLLGQFKEPLSLIIFDHHPDWDIFPPKIGCGSWVNRALKMPNISEVVILGVASSDISDFWIETGNLKALASGRLKIYPYEHKPTRIFFRRLPFSNIKWQELNKSNLNDFFPKLLESLRVKRAYVSIDKDCLNSDFALTNWEEGNLKLGQLLLMLKLIKDKLDIAGVDVTGEYSKVKVANRFKALISRLDHPKDYSAKNKPLDLINTVNEQTNIKIIETLLQPEFSLK